MPHTFDVFQLASAHVLVQGPVQSSQSSPSSAGIEQSCLVLDAAVFAYVPEPVQSLLVDDCCGPESLEGKHICTLLSLCF